MASNLKELEMFYLNSTLNFGIPPVLVFQLEVYYKVDRLLTGLTAQQKGTTARWYSNKTFLLMIIFPIAQIKSMFVYITLTQSLHKEAYVFCMPFSFYF